MYFDYQADLNQRLTSGSNVRVGLTAQGYPFPAPTGVADFSLRLPGSEAVASTVVGIGPFWGPRVEVDAQLPVSDTLGVAGGAGVGVTRSCSSWRRRSACSRRRSIARWRPSDKVEIVPFWSMQDEQRPGGAADHLHRRRLSFRREIERRRYFGPEWAQNEGQDFNYGLLTTFGFGDWTLRGGAFRSIAHDYQQLHARCSSTRRPEGEADREVIAEQARRFASTSGELRLTRQLIEGDRLHMLHLMTRGRMQDRRYWRQPALRLRPRPRSTSRSTRPSRPSPPARRPPTRSAS